jgi:hypothetical protein
MMARYRPSVPEHGRLLPVPVSRQIQPDAFEHTLHCLSGNPVNLRVFEERYDSDKVGARTIDPAIVLKVVLLAYSRGILDSRWIAASVSAIGGVDHHCAKEWSGSRRP